MVQTTCQLTYVRSECSNDGMVEPTLPRNQTLSDLLNLNEFEKKVIELVKRLSHRPLRYRAMNAIDCLIRSWKIHQIDPNMAYFRAMTAKEEAATLLMLTLKHRGYQNASRLKHRDHFTKSAIYEFLRGITLFIASSPFNDPELRIEKENSEQERVILYLKVRQIAPPKTVRMAPIPPLHFTANRGGQAVDFQKELRRLHTDETIKSLRDAVKEDANLRNTILYASDEGLKTVEEIKPALFVDTKDHLIRMFIITLMIAPYKETQSFVQQCLDTFVKALKKLEPDRRIITFN